MITKKIGTASVPYVQELLIETKNERINSQDRLSLPSVVYVYEPIECFSIQKESDLSHMSDSAAFWQYVENNSVPIYRTERGGGIIWHGPGQAILAPVVDLRTNRIDLTTYRKCLEQTLLETVQYFGIDGTSNEYIKGSQGAWAENPQDHTLKKIGFLGFHSSRGVATYGCALNVSCDMYAFSLIYPCNLIGVQATSMEELLGNYTPTVNEVQEVLAENFSQILNGHMHKTYSLQKI
jgi:lipoyl(octanoyl) transferase